MLFVVGVAESPSLFGIGVVVDIVADVSVLVVVVVVDTGALVKGGLVSPLVEISEIMNILISTCDKDICNQS